MPQRDFDELLAVLDLRDGGMMFCHIRHWRRWGDAIRYRFGPVRALAVTHPDAMRYVMIKNKANYIKGEGVESLRWLTGQGLFTADGGLWTTQRRMMQPAFHRRIISQFAELIGEVNEKYAARWAALAARGEPVDITDETSELTLEIVLRSIF